MPGSRRACSLLAIALAGGCDVPEQTLVPPERQLLVHAVLVAGVDEQTMLLEWSDRSARPQNKATVLVTYPDGQPRGFQPGSSTPWIDRYFMTAQATTEVIQPCSTYDLRITEGNRIVTGRTTTPCASAAPQQEPSFEFSRRRDTLRLSWPRVPGAKAYYVAVQNRFVQNPIEPGFAEFYGTFADTSIVWPGTMHTLEGDDMFEVGANVTVVVSAADDNFYTYYHAQVDPFAGAPPSRLEGAIGVFGSIVPILRQGLTIVP